MHKHHFLLFSKYFKYFWKIFFSKHYYTGLIDDTIVYGGYDSGFYVVSKNGISFKITSSQSFSYRKGKPSYVVYVYYHDVFLLKYGEDDSNFVSCLRHNAFLKCKSKQEIMLLIETLLKIFGRYSTLFNEKEDQEVVPMLKFEDIIFGHPENGVRIESNDNGAKFDGLIIINDEKYLLKDMTFNSLCNKLRYLFDEESSIAKKISEYLTYCEYSKFYALFDYKTGNFVGFAINLSKFFSSSMQFYMFDNDKFSHQSSYSSWFGSVKEYEYDENKVNSIFSHFIELVKKELLIRPSEVFYKKANDLGLEINKKEKITPELFEIFEMMNC